MSLAFRPPLETVRTPFRLAACAALILAVTVSACDSGGDAQPATEQDLASDGAAAALFKGLQLTPEQQRQLSSSKADPDTTAGRLWRRAATLQGVLTGAQKDRLFARWKERRAERRNSGGAGKRFVRRLRRLASGLDLTSEQKQSLREVLRDARSSFRALLEQRTEGGVPLDSVRALRTDVKDQLKAILTPDQLQAWKDRRARRKQRRGEAKAVRHDVLALSSSQRRAMKSLFAGRRETRRSLRERFWSGEIDRPEQRRWMREARRAFRNGAAEVLSSKQVETLRLHRILLAYHLRKKIET